MAHIVHDVVLTKAVTVGVFSAICAVCKCETPQPSEAEIRIAASAGKTWMHAFTDFHPKGWWDVIREATFARLHLCPLCIPSGFVGRRS